MANRPAAEIELDEALVQALLRAQCRDLVDQEIRLLSRGWDNTNFRVGEDYVVRLPHREIAAKLILHEQRHLPDIADRVQIPISAPVFCGTPTDDYPWAWSVTPFFEGTDAATATLTDGTATAERLGTFFAQLHTDAGSNAPPNPYRGCPLSDRAESFRSRLTTLGAMDESVTYDRGTYEIAAIAEVFDQACAVAPSTQHVWLHGDLHTRNIIVYDGALAGVIDWGDICAGDRATDLAAAYMLVPDDISTVQRCDGTSQADWQRARGWAINFAVIYLAHSDDDPIMGGIGERLLHALLR